LTVRGLGLSTDTIQDGWRVWSLWMCLEPWKCYAKAHEPGKYWLWFYLNLTREMLPFDDKDVVKAR